jgi:hypothetical protein
MDGNGALEPDKLPRADELRVVDDADEKRWI